MKYIEDNFILIWLSILLSFGSLFMGHEISEIKHSAEVRHNQKIINNCNMIIARGSFQ